MGRKLRSAQTATGGRIYNFYCPGCDAWHGFGEAWAFDGDLESPTVSSSLLSTGETTCHMFIRKGRIEYLADSSHYLAGTTVDMVGVDNFFDSPR